MVNPSDVTIITSIYNIRMIENNNGYKKNINVYTQLGKEFILNVPYNLVIFMDDPDDPTVESNEYKNEINDIYNLIKEHRSHPTYIYKLNFKKTYFYNYLDKLTYLSKTYTIHNIVIEKDTPHYIILTNNKFDFIKRAINMNVYNSTHFLWMDFGINHVAKNTEMIHNWIDKIPNKIKQMCINPYTEDDNPKELFKYVYHHTSAGLFSGDAQHLLMYVDLFLKKNNEIYDNNWYQLDEAVMTLIQRENPNLFEFYYGDYDGIITNYNELNNNSNIVLYGLNKLMANVSKNYMHIINILKYISSYIEKNKNDEFLYNYYYSCKQHTNTYIQNNLYPHFNLLI